MVPWPLRCLSCWTVSFSRSFVPVHGAGDYTVHRTDGAHLPCKVAVEVVGGVVAIKGCECLDWHVRRVVCRHMLFVATICLARSPERVSIHGNPVEFAAAVSLWTAASVDVGSLWCSVPPPFGVRRCALFLVDQVPALLHGLRWAGASRCLSSTAQPSADIPCLQRFVQRGALPAPPAGQSVLELAAAARMGPPGPAVSPAGAGGESGGHAGCPQPVRSYIV